MLSLQGEQKEIIEVDHTKVSNFFKLRNSSQDHSIIDDYTMMSVLENTKTSDYHTESPDLKKPKKFRFGKH